MANSQVPGEVCGRALQCMEAYANHVKACQNESDYLTCDSCKRAFLSRQGYVNHVNARRKKLHPVTCDICGRRFGNCGSCAVHNKACRRKKLAQSSAAAKNSVKKDVTNSSPAFKNSSGTSLALDCLNQGCQDLELALRLHPVLLGMPKGRANVVKEKSSAWYEGKGRIFRVPEEIEEASSSNSNYVNSCLSSKDSNRAAFNDVMDIGVAGKNRKRRRMEETRMNYNVTATEGEHGSRDFFTNLDMLDLADTKPGFPFDLNIPAIDSGLGNPTALNMPAAAPVLINFIMVKPEED